MVNQRTVQERNRDHDFMEPRPQRPRTQIGPNPQGRPQGRQPGPGASQGQPPQGGHPGQGEYGEGTDPATFIAPSRTDYDYSPLDLAPPGQRRRRQFVAAAVGGLTVLLLAAIAVFGYLLLRDEPADNDDNDVIAAQTELADSRATIAAQETIVAQAAAEQTAVAQGPGASSATPPPAADPGAAAADAPVAGATEPPAETPADAAEAETAQTPEELAALLPAAGDAPAGLDTASDSELDQAGVAEALGGGRLAEQNLETWEWSGNAQRVFSPSDPEAIDAEATTFLSVSVHGFGTPEASAEALPFFSDILVESGWEEAEAPDLGDGARLLQSVGEDGTTNVALYIQDGTVLYRIGGASAGGDPTEDVTDVATAILEP